MDVSIDSFDPVQRDEVVLTVTRTRFGDLDRFALDVIDRTDTIPTRADDVHAVCDVGGIDGSHEESPDEFGMVLDRHGRDTLVGTRCPMNGH